MLVNTFGKELTASSVVKNSQFYIEVAKFVQAYTVILHNPNEFLNEVGERQISENEKITWQSLSKIMQTCDFGFSEVPTNSDLVVYYNYAIEMGSISRSDKRIASVDDIADAQKNYYNFVDDAKDRAEAEFLKQHRITKIREKEVRSVNGKLRSYSCQRWIAFSFMIVAVVMFCLGVAGLFFNNAFVEMIGSIIPIWQKQYVGSIILILIAVLLFYLSDKWNVLSKQKYKKLNHASQTIFSRNNSNFVTEQILKYKLDALKRDLQIIHNELKDENKTFDVKATIEKLLESNSYYKKFSKAQESALSAEAKSQQMAIEDERALADDELASSQEIILEGQFDEAAYNEKFENAKKPKSKPLEKTAKENEETEEKEETLEEKQEDAQAKEMQEKQLRETEKTMVEDVEKEQQLIDASEISEESLQEYVDYLRDLFGDDAPDNTLQK